jgi:two-component system phosphate regulon response regulator PhoB
LVPDNITTSNKPLVLIVEDEAALMTMLRYNLEKQGFRVEEAGDGEDAGAHAPVEHRARQGRTAIP